MIQKPSHQLWSRFFKSHQSVLIYSYSIVLAAVCPYERRQDGASYPGTEPALHCSVVGYQLQPHALQITGKHVKLRQEIEFSDVFASLTKALDDTVRKQWH